MTKEKLWSIYVKKNPSFEGDGTVTMTCKGLRKFFDTTWDTAYYDGEEEDVGNTEHIFQQDTAGVDFLKSIFGMK